VESAPRAYKLKASNAAPPISTIAGTSRRVGLGVDALDLLRLVDSYQPGFGKRFF
jgi:hypothetical protein